MIFFYFIIFFFIINLSIYLNHNKLKLLGIPFDNPDKVRKFHKKPVLISGGFILFINIQILLIFLINFQDTFLNNMFNTQIDIITFSIIISFFFLLGIYDDKKNINPNLKLILLGIMVYLLIISNENLIINEIRLSFLNQSYGLGNFSTAFTILCFLLFINALNMFDGINLQSFSYVFFIFIYFLINEIFVTFSLMLLVPLIIFGFLNYRNNSFFGDSGCYLISVIIGSLFITSYNLNKIQSADTIFLLMILPGIDMLRLFTFRIINKKNPFKPDRNHIHHKLLYWLGYDKTISVIILFNIFILAGISAKISNLIILICILFTYFFLIYLSKNFKLIK